MCVCVCVSTPLPFPLSVVALLFVGRRRTHRRGYGGVLLHTLGGGGVPVCIKMLMGTGGTHEMDAAGGGVGSVGLAFPAVCRSAAFAAGLRGL